MTNIMHTKELSSVLATLFSELVDGAAAWDEAWKTTIVDTKEWDEIRSGLGREVHAWLDALKAPREVSPIELTGMIASIAHLAYHVGAIRQIDKSTRGPKEGTF
jgi:hypothetical protein